MTRNRSPLHRTGSPDLAQRAPLLARTGLGLLGTAAGIGLDISITAMMIVTAVAAGQGPQVIAAMTSQIAGQQGAAH